MDYDIMNNFAYMFSLLDYLFVIKYQVFDYWVKG